MQDVDMSSPMCVACARVHLTNLLPLVMVTPVDESVDVVVMWDWVVVHVVVMLLSMLNSSRSRSNRRESPSS